MDTESKAAVEWLEAWYDHPGVDWHWYEVDRAAGEEKPRLPWGLWREHTFGAFGGGAYTPSMPAVRPPMLSLKSDLFCGVVSHLVSEPYTVLEEQLYLETGTVVDSPAEALEEMETLEREAAEAAEIWRRHAQSGSPG